MRYLGMYIKIDLNDQGVHSKLRWDKLMDKARGV